MARPVGRERIQGDPSDVTSIRKMTMGKGMQVVYDNPYNNAKQRGVRNKTIVNPNLKSNPYRNYLKG